MTGTVVISLDAELAWGYHDEHSSSAGGLARRTSNRARQAYRTVTRGHYADHGITSDELATARRSWLRLLDAFEEFDTPATWAVIGHLFLDECEGEHRSHPLSPGWFASDPGGTAAEQPSWFAGDLIDAIADSPTEHEIGSHTFSHVVFGAPTTNSEVASAELRAATDAAAAHDCSLTSLVFPRNWVGHRDVLAEHGFTCYRGNRARWYDDALVRPAAKMANMGLQFSPPPVGQPTVDEHGLVDIPASLNLFSFEGLARSLIGPVVTDPIVRQAKLGIERAINEDGVFHLWFHPNDVLRPSHIERMRTVLAHVDERRSQGELTVETMSSLAERTKANATG